MVSRSAAEPWREVALAGSIAGLFGLLGIVGAPAPVVAFAVALAAALACWAPVAAIGAVALALPYFYRPLQIGGAQVAASELLLAAALVGAGLRALLPLARQPRLAMPLTMRAFTELLRSRLLVLCAALAVVGALLALWPYAPAYRADAVREWRWTLLEPCLFLGLLVVAGTRTPAARRVLAWCFVAGATVAAFHALSNLALGGGVDVEGVRRIAGPYPHPDALALYVLRGAVFAATWAAGERVARWLAGSCAVVCLVALAASYSRGAYAAAALALLVVVWSVAPRLRWPALIAVAVAVVAAVAFAGQRMLSLFHGGSGSLRLDIWRAALTMIRDRPVRGYGPDQFLYVYAPRYIAPTAWGERFTSHPHDVVLDFWLTLGIIGAAVALWGAAWIVIRVVATFGKPSADDALQFAAVAALLAALAHGLVDNAYFLHDLAMSAWLLIWLACPVAWQGEALAKGTPSVEGARGWRGRIHRLPSV